MFFSRSMESRKEYLEIREIFESIVFFVLTSRRGKARGRRDEDGIVFWGVEAIGTADGHFSVANISLKFLFAFCLVFVLLCGDEKEEANGGGGEDDGVAV